MATTLQVDGVATFTGRDIHSGGITIANAGQIGSVGDADAIAIASDGVVTLTQKLIGTELDISGNIDVDGTTNLDAVDIDGAVQLGASDDDIRMTLTGNNQYRLALVNGSAASVILGSGGANNFRISNSGGATIFEIDDNKDIILPGSGAGIHLGVTSATASNLLADYEEGTWTPAFASTNATFGYATAGGTYTKVGRLCMLSFRLTISGAPGGTTSNGVVVTGMPFNSASLAGTYHGGTFGHYFNINLSATGVMVYQTASGGATVELKVVGDNLGETGVLASHLNSGAQIRGQIIYHTA
jgi:hypothetical protein